MRVLRRLLLFVPFAVLLPSLALLLSTPALAVDTAVGQIISAGSSTTNRTTATPFVLYARSHVSIQCNAAVYVAEGPGASPPTVTAVNGVQIQSGQLFDIDLTDPQNASDPNQVIGILPVSGSATCTVFRSP